MATSTIGALSVKITSDTSGLDDGVKKSKSGLSSIGKSATESAAKVAKWGAVAVAAATAAGVAIVKANLDSIDALAKTADKIGLSTESLQGLQHAAELTGVSVGTMNTSLQRMTRRISEAAQGTGVAVGALDELGIAVEDIQNLSADEQMLAIADAMEQVGSQSDKLRLSIALFDTEGAALVNTLNGGSEALKGMMNEVNELGFAISRIDAARIEQANDAFLRGGKLVKGLGQSFTIALSPFITQATKDLTDMGREGILSTSSIEDGVYKVAMVGALVADSFRGVSIIIDGLKAAAYGLGYGFAQIWPAVIRGVEAADKAFVALGNSGLSTVEAVANGFLYMGNQIEKAYLSVKLSVLTIFESMTNAMDSLINSTKDSINSLITAMSNIPGVDIEVMETGASETTKAVTNAVNATKQEIASINEGIDPIDLGRLVADDGYSEAIRNVNKFGNDMYMEMNQSLWDAANSANETPMTEVVKKWLDDAKAASDAAIEDLGLGEGLTVNLPSISGGDPEGPTEDSDAKPSATFEYEQETIGLLEAMNMRFTSQEEAQLAANQRQQEMLQAQYDQGLLTQEQFNEQSARLTQAAEEAKRKITIDNLQAGFQAIAANSKKVTKLMQGVAIYQAVIKGKQAAVDAWQAGMSVGGPYAPLVAAAYTAASIANTASMINSIKSGGSSMGGTSSGSTPSVGTGDSSSGTGDGSEQSMNKTVSINMVGGSSFSTDQVRELIGQINEAVGDGMTLQVGA